MKRILSLLIVFILLSSFVCSCSLLPEELKLCKVNFYVDGELYTSKNVVLGQSVGMPQSPEKQNFVFTGWRTEGIKPHAYDFSSKVLTNLNLHATFTLDTVAVGNMISQTTIHSTVKVISKFEIINHGRVETQISQGSGVVIDVSGGYCYVLTNAHVVTCDDDYDTQKITVEDPFGVTCEAQIYKNSNKEASAVAEEYDLALICFKYSKTQSFIEIEFGEDPDVNDYVIAIGHPKGLYNTVSYGSVSAYHHVKGDEGSAALKITFDSIIHNAPINHGSSGGALIDANGKLVGVNFAGYTNYDYACAIPISKVIEFLNIYVYE